MLLSGAFLSSFMLVGCNADDEDQNPPPQDVVDNDDGANIKNIDRNRINDFDDDNRINDINRNDRLNNNVHDRIDNTGYDDLDNGVLNGNNNGPRTTTDRNTRQDLDPIKDRNTPGEDLIEDRNDMRDRNTKDR